MNEDVTEICDRCDSWTQKKDMRGNFCAWCVADMEKMLAHTPGQPDEEPLF